MSQQQIVEFQRRLIVESQRVLIYEDPLLQAKARLCVPLTALTARAAQSCTAASNIDLKDGLLIEILHWFKEDFFVWFDKPYCNICSRDMIGFGSGNPSAEDLGHGAQRVEVYKCESCAAVDRFPRYNDPGKNLFI